MAVTGAVWSIEVLCGYGVPTSAANMLEHPLYFNLTAGADYGLYVRSSTDTWVKADDVANAALTTAIATKANANAVVPLVTTTPKPDAAAAHRGKFYITQGATDVADTVEICVKKSDNTYEWHSILDTTA
jgi:hypothetical protein